MLPSWIWLGPPGKAVRRPHPTSAGRSRDRPAPSTWTPHTGPFHIDTVCPAPLRARETLKRTQKEQRLCRFSFTQRTLVNPRDLRNLPCHPD